MLVIVLSALLEQWSKRCRLGGYLVCTCKWRHTPIVGVWWVRLWTSNRFAPPLDGTAFNRFVFVRNRAIKDVSCMGSTCCSAIGLTVILSNFDFFVSADPKVYYVGTFLICLHEYLK